jgi:hypothetical protein
MRLVAVAVLAVVSVAVAARADGPPPPPLDSRTPRVRAKLLEDFGGTVDTEKAVAAGLAWLAKQQKGDGSWAFDGKETKETAAATGLALLAFLGAGESHKDAKAKYKATVQKGLDWLRKDLGANGKFRTGQTMYSQGIASLALVDAYAQTFDGALKPSAQACVIFVQRAQAKDGSWGYKEGAPTGDLSIVGWQLQVLHAAKRGKLVVDQKAVKAAVAFLDTVAAGEAKDRYGYTTNAGAQPGTALTAIGLWARANFDDWTADTPGMSAGAKGLLKARPPANQLNFYQLHYATMVLRGASEEQWREWNEGPKGADGTRTGGMREVLVKAQEANGADAGSWKPDPVWMGQQCGRVGTTALAVMCLEAYYRYVPPAPKAK